MGYLRLDVNTVTNTNTKGVVPENYNPKQLYVAIVDADGKTVASTENFASEWGNGKEFQLKSGVYSIKANSNGFDGFASRYGDQPYYAGETTVTVKAGNSVSVNLVCTLADVKVTVRFESSFTKAFKAAETTLSTPNVTPLRFAMGSVNSIGYLPVGDLSSSITVQTQAGEFKSQNNQVITDVKPRDHYIFVYKVDLEGDGKIEVEADDSQRTYTYIFPVTTTSSTTAKVDAANAWSNFAYLSGSVAPKDPTTVIPVSDVKFEYQLSSSDETSDPWTTMNVEANGTNAYKATLKGLTPGTSYRYRLVYTGVSESSVSSVKTFKTEDAIALYNGGFENWYSVQVGFLKKDLWYPNKNGESFWDTSNPGCANYIGSVTSLETSKKHGGNYSAKLASTYAVVKFAAASLYAGEFGNLVGTNGAWLNWGRPFNARPSQLKGWYQYTTGKVDKESEEGPLSSDDNDLWSAQVVLVDLGSADYVRVDNTDMSTFPDWNTDSRVIAYGKLSDDFCKQQKTNWTQFVIDLDYKNLTKKPTHIIIVFSSSKYGDYFEGSTSSLLYLDDLEFVYGEPNS